MPLLRRVVFTLSAAAVASLAAAGLLTASAAPNRAAPTPTLSALHRFTGADGMQPQSVVVQASDGNLYGTTPGCAQQCMGTVYKLTPGGQFTLLHTFGPQTVNGAVPFSGLVEGPDGFLYGTTYEGGTSNDGTVYKISTSGQFVKLHDFCYQPQCVHDTDGRAPMTGLVLGRDGNLYGKTTRGGDISDPDGTIYRISPSGDFKVVFTFKFTPMGATADGGGLLPTSDGNFYTPTIRFLFRITPDGRASTLHQFVIPEAGIREFTQANNGKLYGVQSGLGQVFQANLDGTGFRLIHLLSGTAEGVTSSSLIQANDGNLWATTAHSDQPGNYGNIFSLTTDGTLIQTIPMRLEDTGAGPEAPLIQGRDGKLYGTASAGGSPTMQYPGSFGTVFVIDLAGGPAPVTAAPVNSPTPVPTTSVPVTSPAPTPVPTASAPDTPVAPASLPMATVRIGQTADGTLYLVTGAGAWQLVPAPIGAADLSVLNIGTDQAQGVVSLQPGPAALVESDDDDALYVVQGQQATPLVPQPLGNEEAAALTRLGVLSGNIPPEAETPPSP